LLQAAKTTDTSTTVD